MIRERLTSLQAYCVMQAQAGATTPVIAKRLGVPRRVVIESLESAYARLREDLRDIGHDH